MHVSIDSERNTAVLSAGSDEEEGLLRQITGSVQVGGHLKYGGRSGGNPNSPPNQRMELRFEFPGGILKLLASEDNEEDAVRMLRDAIYFGGGGLFLLSHRIEDGKTTIEVCVTYCKNCHAPITRFENAEGQTCDPCRQRCDHKWKEGLVHGGSAGQLGVGKFCTKCNIGKTNEEPEVVIPHPQQA